jgi:hypothetical protein
MHVYHKIYIVLAVLAAAIAIAGPHKALEG